MVAHAPVGYIFSLLSADVMFVGNRRWLTDCANLQATPAIAVAEKAADLILEDLARPSIVA